MSSTTIAQNLAKNWYPAASERMSKAYALSPRLLFDDQSRLIFFSDHHRGTNGRDDSFAANANLFEQTLQHYFAERFTYVELGDGDELWYHGSFDRIRHTYRSIYDWMYRFQDAHRLHAIMGNHESLGGLFDEADKGGIPLLPGLVLQHARSGQTLFAVHGHQAHKSDDRFWWMNRLISHYFWRHVHGRVSPFYHLTEPTAVPEERHQLANPPLWFSEWVLNQARQVERSIHNWQRQQRQIVLSGHTHMTAFPTPGGLPYFNTGHCMTPGYLTGLEIFQGQIALVKWKLNGRVPQRLVMQQRPLSQVGFA